MSSFLTASTNGVAAKPDDAADSGSSVSSSPVPPDLRPTNSTPKRRNSNEGEEDLMVRSSQPVPTQPEEQETTTSATQPTGVKIATEPTKRARVGDLVQETTTALQRVKVEMARFADFISDSVPQSEREEDVIDGARIAYLSLLGDQLKQIAADWPHYS